MRAALLAAALVLLAGPVSAQTPPPAPELPRADAHVVIGWQNLRQDQPESHYKNWINDIFYAGAGGGWYWNDHLKMQVDYGAGTRGDQYRYRPVEIANGSPAYGSSRLRVRQQSVAAGLQYQFYRNAWFHPHLGAGVDLARETSQEEFEPVYTYDNVTRLSRTLVPAHTDPPRHRFVPRAFAETGFKAYMTERAFFTGDLRLMIRGGIDEVLFRTGFGFDF